MRMIITREEARDMDQAHAEGWHEEAPREGCPSCSGRDLASYPTEAQVQRRAEAAG